MQNLPDFGRVNAIQIDEVYNLTSESVRHQIKIGKCVLQMRDWFKGVKDVIFSPVKNFIYKYKQYLSAIVSFHSFILFQYTLVDKILVLWRLPKSNTSANIQFSIFLQQKLSITLKSFKSFLNTYEVYRYMQFLYRPGVTWAMIFKKH